jgi:membrane protease YdiL (CAAX protease family)
MAGAARFDATAMVLPLLVAPWVEEVLFRRGLHDSLRSRLTPQATITVVAIGFGMAHAAVVVALPGPPSSLALTAALATAVPAWLIGQSYQRHACLAVCVAGHAAANLVGLIALR